MRVWDLGFGGLVFSRSRVRLTQDPSLLTGDAGVHLHVCLMIPV